MKLVITLFVCYFTLHVGLVLSEEITISGSVKDTNGKPVGTSVVVMQPSNFFPGGGPSEKFRKLGSSRSNSDTGDFSIKIDTTSVDRVIVAAWYRSTEYYIYSEVNQLLNDTTNLNVVLPAENKNEKSVSFDIHRNGSQIEYGKEGFVIALVETGNSSMKRFVNLTAKDKVFFSELTLYDLPDGEYRLKCKVAYKKNNVVETSEILTTLVLPLANNDKIFTINLVSP